MYYKILSVTSVGNLYSGTLPEYSSVMGKASEYTLTYRVGIKTKPKFGKLFVFDNIENARNHCNIGDMIYACDAENTKYSDKVMIPNVYCVSLEHIIDFWLGKTYDDPWLTPKGTMFADSVTLLYKVK